MSWNVEYGTKKKTEGGRALLWVVGAVLVWSALVFSRGVMKEQLRAVEDMALHLQEGMSLGEAVQTFCQEVFPDGFGH